MFNKSEIRPQLLPPFILAATIGDSETVARLLTTLSEPELNWRGAFGNTALQWAIANSNSRIALQLLEHTPRIKVNLLDATGKTSLHL